VTQIDLLFLRLKGKERGGSLIIFEVSLRISREGIRLFLENFDKKMFSKLKKI